MTNRATGWAYFKHQMRCYLGEWCLEIFLRLYPNYLIPRSFAVEIQKFLALTQERIKAGEDQ